MKFTIDTEHIKKLVARSNEIFLEPEGEKTLLEFSQIKELVEQAEKEIKEKLTASAKRMNPNFKSIQGDNVVVYLREFGAKYYIEDKEIDKVPTELYTTKATVQVVQPNLSYSEIVKRAQTAGLEIPKRMRGGKEEYSINRVVSTSAVDKWVKDNGKMPFGVFEDQNRSASMTIKLKKEHE